MPEDPARAEPQQRERPGVAERAAVEVEQADRQLVVEQQRQPPRDREHRERRDERHHAAVGDRDRVDRAEQQSRSRARREMNVNVVPFGSTSTAAEQARPRRRIEPTDRSMPAVAITNVMPIASTPTTLAWVSMLRTLSQVGNVSGFRIAPATNSSDRRRTRARTPAPAGRGPLERRARRFTTSSFTATSSARSGVVDGRDGVPQQLALGGAVAGRPRPRSRPRA